MDSFWGIVFELLKVLMKLLKTRQAYWLKAIKHLNNWVNNIRKTIGTSKRYCKHVSKC